LLNFNHLIDIILPVYNSENYLDETLNSIINQDYQKYKVYIIDDCSTDNSYQVIKKYLNGKIFCIRLKKNMGPAFCRNLGMRMSSSNVICFIDSDDLWSEKKLSKQLSFMIKEKTDFSYTNYKTFKKNNMYKDSISTPKFFNYLTFTKNTSIATSSMMLNRSIIGNIKFKKIGYGFDDYIFKCDILRKNNLTARGLQEYLTFYRLRQGSISSKSLRNIFWIWKINKNYLQIKLLENIYCLICITLNSIKKYKFKL